MAEQSLRSFEYLESLSGTELGRLYQQPSTALAVFRRMLPNLAKSIVLAILYNPDPLTGTDLDSWIKQEFERDAQKAILLLTRLHIIENAHDVHGRISGYGLRKGFSDSLQKALTGGGDHSSFGVPCNTQAERKVTIDTLDGYARKRWESMLGYMVSSTSNLAYQFGEVEPTVQVLLKMGGYVEERARARVTITEKGFELLMQKTNAQVWALLVVYLSSSTEETHINPTDALSFFFMLGSLELGQDYSTSNLTPSQKIILEDLGHLGLVYQNSTDPTRFYPTRLATTLTSDSPALRETSPNISVRGNANSDEGDGFIVVETNYRVYAYTSSPLYIAILALFTNLSVVFPNLVAGKITRKSVRRAVDMGVKADQITEFLTAHAHPQMRKSSSAEGYPQGMMLPPTVVDQIRLWQLENERMVATPGYLFKEFNSEADYKQLLKYADQIGVLKWQNDKARKFFVTRHEQLAAYYRNNMTKKAANQQGRRG